MTRVGGSLEAAVTVRDLAVRVAWIFRVRDPDNSRWTISRMSASGAASGERTIHVFHRKRA